MLSNDRSNATGVATLGPSLIVKAAAIAALAAFALLLFHPSAGNAATGKGPVVSTGKASLGQILVNSRGVTLYLFQKDKSGMSACAGQCATAWPPLIATGKPLASAGAKASLLGVTKRADGRMQVTYNHHPLYTFVKDTKKGQTNGEGVNAFGANWYGVSPAGAAIIKASTPTPSPATGGGGY